MTLTLWILLATALLLALVLVLAVRSRRSRGTIIFLGLSLALLVLVGGAAAQDSRSRDYLAIQDQYKKDHPAQNGQTQPDTKVQQLFPQFAAARQGDTYRTERCISCHVPDIGTIGPDEAAKRLYQDFLKYEPNAQQIIKRDGLSGHHPAKIDASLYALYGATSSSGGHQYTDTTTDPPSTGTLPGPIQAIVSPQQNGNKPLGIDQTGCIVCHNGNRLSLDQTDAHRNMIINPEYDFTEGAALYYKNCATCHGNMGDGGIGPPLNNQDRLGYFDEDYYYRCIEYGYTDFEHLNAKMPAWGSMASDYSAADQAADPQKRKAVHRQLSEDQIKVLEEFIRHWENYETLP